MKLVSNGKHTKSSPKGRQSAPARSAAPTSKTASTSRPASTPRPASTSRTASSARTSAAGAGAARTAAARTPAASAKKKTAKKGHGRVIAAVISVILAAVVLGGAVGVFAINSSDRVFPNVRLDGEDIGGMTNEELTRYLETLGFKAGEAASVTVELPLDFELTVSADEVCSNTENGDIVKAVMNVCHAGSPLSVAARYLRCRVSGMDIDSNVAMTIDEEAVRAKVAGMVQEVNLALLSSDVTVGEDSIRVVKGASSVSIDEDEITDLIVEAFETHDYGTIVYESKIDSDDELDLEELYRTVTVEPQDAIYDVATGEITPEKVGLTFDIANARALWNNAAYGEEVIIPLTVTQPEITAESLKSMLFRDKLSSRTTSLGGSSSSRINNVTLAAKAINGYVLNPGDEFSYNAVVGQRTPARGYQMAGAYSAGQTVQEYGGGICQVSSTLYCCALYANLSITARTCHMFPVSYLPAGLDATVSWGGPEFKFVNSRSYPIKIVASVQNGGVTVELWGTDVDGSYVEMLSSTSSIANGYKAVTTRNVYSKDGTLISSKTEATSSYSYHTSESSATEAPEPEETPPSEPTPPAGPTEPTPPSGPVEPDPPPGPTEPDPPAPPPVDPPPSVPDAPAE